MPLCGLRFTTRAFHHDPSSGQSTSMFLPTSDSCDACEGSNMRESGHSMAGGASPSPRARASGACLRLGLGNLGGRGRRSLRTEPRVRLPPKKPRSARRRARQRRARRPPSRSSHAPRRSQAQPRRRSPRTRPRISSAPPPRPARPAPRARSLDRCAHPSRRGRRRARLEVSTEEKRAQIIVKVALPA